MRLSRLDIRFLARELQNVLEGAVVRACGSPRPGIIALEFRRPGESVTLVFRLDARFPAVYVTGEKLKVKPPRGGPRFLADLDHALGGCWLESVRQWAFERLLVFHFRRGPDSEGFELFFEAYGTLPNLILSTPSSSHVLAAYNVDGKSGVSLGQSYAPSLSPDAILPEVSDWPAEVGALVADADGERSLSRISNRTGLPEIYLQRLMRQIRANPETVQEHLKEQQYRILECPPEPSLVDGGEKGKALYLYPPDATEPLEFEPFSTLSAAIEALWEEVVESGEEDLRKRILMTLKREEKSERRKLENIDQDLEESEDASRDRHLGELLLAHLHSIEAGDSLAIVPDPARENAQVEIPLDSRLSPSANAQEYFERYKRKRRKTDIAGERRRETLARLDHIGTLIEETDSAKDRDTLLDIARRASREAPQLLSLIREETKSGAGRAAKEKKDPYPFARLFYSADGFRLLVGKDARANDELVRRAAHGNDLWFHTEEFAGSHVLIKRDGFSGEIPRETILDAAQLAAHYSSLRGDSQTVIHYTECKYVRKPKGLPPGKVLYSRQKTLIVGPDPRRMERLSRSVQEREIEELFK